jgi:hypothetical protein
VTASAWSRTGKTNATGLTIASYTLVDGLGVRAAPIGMMFLKERFGARRVVAAVVIAAASC